MSCLSFTKIPEMTCRPPYSIRRIPTTLPTSLDTTSLSGLYGYTSADFNAEWDYVTYAATGGSVVGSSPGACDCSSDVSKQEYTYISWLEPCRKLSGDRMWVTEEVSCSVDGKTYPSAVAYATNRPTFMPTPVFNPNQAAGGGGGSVEVHDSVGKVGRVVQYLSDRYVSVRLIGVKDGHLIETDEYVTAQVIGSLENIRA